MEPKEYSVLRNVLVILWCEQHFYLPFFICMNPSFSLIRKDCCTDTSFFSTVISSLTSSPFWKNYDKQWYRLEVAFCKKKTFSSLLEHLTDVHSGMNENIIHFWINRSRNFFFDRLCHLLFCLNFFPLEFLLRPLPSLFFRI